MGLLLVQQGRAVSDIAGVSTGVRGTTDDLSLCISRVKLRTCCKQERAVTEEAQTDAA